MGKIFISTELGGGGRATASSAKIAKRGVRNFSFIIKTFERPDKLLETAGLANRVVISRSHHYI